MLEFVIDMTGQLWRGGTHPERNLHWERFEGKSVDGKPIWHLRRATRPLSSSPISHAAASQLIDQMPATTDPQASDG